MEAILGNLYFVPETQVTIYTFKLN